jgi:hypothetical protein
VAIFSPYIAAAPYFTTALPFNPPPPPPQFTLQYTGFEATVRKYLPENVHVRFACNRFRQPVCETARRPAPGPAATSSTPPHPAPFFLPAARGSPLSPPLFPRLSADCVRRAGHLRRADHRFEAALGVRKGGRACKAARAGGA